MKLLRISILLSFLVAFLWVSSVSAFTIDDNYIGADPTNDGYDGLDRIGNADLFEVYGMNVSFDFRKKIIVSINSSYFDNIGAYSTYLGDLFISTDGYNPVNPTENDWSYNGEDWEYAFVLDSHDANFGSGTLYDTNGDGEIILSSAPDNYIYRAGQEVQYDPEGKDGEGDGTWGIFGDWLTFYIPWLDDWNGVEVFGFHWAMTCANDVIEGAAPVPEPATMLLLGTGLLGIAGVGRKKLFKS
jgi:hypothetical protein